MKQPPLLHTDVYGKGPTIVLLHGFLASSQYWKKVSELVDQDYRVVTMDLLGFGESPKPKGISYDYADHIASINATLAHLNISEPFILMGHSMGSLISLRYATLYSDRVRKLILINMPVMLGAREVRRTIMRPNIVYNLGLMPLTHRVTWAVFRSLYRMKLLPRRVKERVKNDASYMFSHTASSRMGSFRNVIEQARVDFDLSTVKVKTLLLSGLEDNKIYIDNLLNNIQLSPTVAIENIQTGHHIPRLFPEIIAKRIRDK